MAQAGERQNHRGEEIYLLKYIDGSLIINPEALGILAEHGTKEVAVYSINGLPKTGKSFMLNCFLTFLRNGSLEGFPGNIFEGFKSSDRDPTIGIVMWSEPLIIKKGKKEFYLILLDIQGCFENQHTFLESAVITTLSYLLSSLFIYNSKIELNTRDYSILRMIAKFASSQYLTDLPTGNDSFNPQLLFLRRNEVNENNTGWLKDKPREEIGFDIINLSTDDSVDGLKNKFHNFIIQSLRGRSNSMNSYSMPHPGTKFEYYGCFMQNYSDKDQTLFCNSIKEFLSEILNPDKIIMKKRDNENMKANDLCSFLSDSVKICDFAVIKEIPHSSTRKVYEMMDEIEVINICDALKEYYLNKMKIEEGSILLTKQDFESKHNVVRSDLIKLFVKGVDTNPEKKKYEKSLLREIDSQYMQLKATNSNANDIKQKKDEILELEKELLSIEQKLEKSHEEKLKKEKKAIEDKLMLKQNELSKKYEEDILRISQKKSEFTRKLNRNFLYRMVANPSGICLIVNIIRFKDEDDFRHGAEQDTVRFESTFQALSYEVLKSSEELKKGDLIKFLKDGRDKITESHDSLIVIISSHGDERNIITSDGKIQLFEILEIFNNVNCDKLKGKPKMFFVISCRGGQIDMGSTRLTVSVEDSREYESKIHETKTSESSSEIHAITSISSETTHPTDLHELTTLPTFSDMIVCYSTMQGYVSYRDIYKGSWLGIELSDVFDRLAGDCDLETLLKMVTKKVILRGRKGHTQAVTVEMIGWLKYLYFVKDDSKTIERSNYPIIE